MAYNPDAIVFDIWGSPLSIVGSDRVQYLDEAVNEIITEDSASLVNFVNEQMARLPQYFVDELGKMNIATLEYSSLERWESEAYALTSESYAKEPLNTPVNIFTSNDDGTFTSTPTSPAEYSALHNSLVAGWNAEAEALTAKSYSDEAYGVPVKEYVSNDDGTFTATDTSPIEYSALHYSALSESGVKYKETPVVTDGQTVINTLNDPSDAEVYVNGVLLSISGGDYTTTTSSLTLAEPIQTTDGDLDEVQVISGTILPVDPNSDMVAYVDTIASLSTVDPLFNSTAIVQEAGQGGTFVYDASLVATNNGGTIFDGWVRQYGAEISPKWFGAVADGATDDTAILQATIDFGFDNNKAVLIDGVFKITSSIELPPLVNLRGFGEGSPKSSLASSRPSEIISSGTGADTTFTIGTTASIKGVIDGIVFRGTGASLATLVDDVSFAGTLRGCTIYNYAFVFGESSTLSLAYILNNDIQAVGGTAFNCGISDSLIDGNYLNGGSNSGNNATCFYQVTTTVITNNYIDFFKFVFGKSTTNTDLPTLSFCSVTSNVIERSYRVIDFGTDTFGRLNQCSISDNIIRYCKYSSSIAYFSNPDADMLTDPWGFCFLSGVTRVSFMGNFLTSCDVGYKVFNFPVYDLKEYGTVLDRGSITTPLDFNVADSGTNDLDNVHMDLLGMNGEFTPVVIGSTTAGAGTYTTQTGKYKRDGFLVHFEIVLGWSAHTGVGDLQIDGLPFLQGKGRQVYNIVAETLTFSGQLTAMSNNQNTTKINLYGMATGAGLSAVAIDTAVSYMVITGQYKVYNT